MLQRIWPKGVDSPTLVLTVGKPNTLYEIAPTQRITERSVETGKSLWIPNLLCEFQSNSKTIDITITNKISTV